MFSTLVYSTYMFDVTDRVDHHCGQWTHENAGGQISNETFEVNPQYEITVEGKMSTVFLSYEKSAFL